MILKETEPEKRKKIKRRKQILTQTVHMSTEALLSKVTG